MDVASQVAVMAPIGAFCVGVGLVRRKTHKAVGAALVGAAVVAGAVQAALGAPQPLVGLIGVGGLLGGISVDRPGRPGRRALGLLGISVGMFALLIARFYT